MSGWLGLFGAIVFAALVGLGICASVIQEKSESPADYERRRRRWRRPLDR